MERQRMLELIRKRDEALVHFVRYVLAGTCAVTVQFVVLTVLVELVRLNPTLSSGCGFVAGCSTNYFLQYYFTFKAQGKHLHTIPVYVMVNIVTLLVNLIVFWSLTNLFGLWYVLSQVVAIGCVVCINFFANRRWTFRHR